MTHNVSPWAPKGLDIDGFYLGLAVGYNPFQGK